MKREDKTPLGATANRLKTKFIFCVMLRWGRGGQGGMDGMVLSADSVECASNMCKPVCVCWWFIVVCAEMIYALFANLKSKRRQLAKHLQDIAHTPRCHRQAQKRAPRLRLKC